jgi:hypothetical protein
MSEHPVLRQFRRYFGPSWEPTPPPPDDFTDPLAIDMWNVIAGPRFDRAAFDAVLQKHSPAIIAASMRCVAEKSGAADELEFYA